jgi:hypothetical protein
MRLAEEPPQNQTLSGPGDKTSYVSYNTYMRLAEELFSPINCLWFEPYSPISSEEFPFVSYIPYMKPEKSQ